MLISVDSFLCVIDVQGTLSKVVEDSQFHLSQIKKLILGVKALSLPILLTAQAPEKIGHTIPEVSELIPEVNEIPRTSFSLFREIALLTEMHNINRKQVILCGFEAHICLYQSAIDLINAGYEVHLAVDATSSRSKTDKEIALQRIYQAGGNLVTVEMALFEMLRDAVHPEFRTISKIIK